MGKDDLEDDGVETVEIVLRGKDLIRNPLLNKGSAFTPEERKQFGIEGLLPDHSNSMDVQAKRIYASINKKDDPLEKYIGLMALQDRNEHLFYRVLMDHLEEFMPIVYTPTVGQATQNFSHVFRRGRGVWITPHFKGRVAQVLANAAGRHPIQLIVATDGQSILGIGDQGAGGMAISVGKLALYTAGAGIDPALSLPVCLDVGTDNEKLLTDDFYLGWPHRRLRGAEYDELLDEFVAAVKQVFPDALMQWEDFRKDNALNILQRYRDALPSFNDDIQGTGAVAAAGLLSSCRVSGTDLKDQRIVIFGAGAAGLGIATQLQSMLLQSGVAEQDLYRHIVVLDSRGLIATDRDISDKYKHKLAWPAEHARDIGLGADQDRDLLAVVRCYRPTALIGSSGQAGSFTEDIVRAMADHTERPVILPFSNPTSITEATPEDVIRWTAGRGLVATGSPFAPVSYEGRTFEIGQGNNVFIFPGLGLGTLLSGARTVTDGMISATAHALAQSVTEEELARGLLYPAINRLRDVSRAITRAVMVQAIEEGVATQDPGSDIDAVIETATWTPHYRKYVAV